MRLVVLLALLPSLAGAQSVSIPRCAPHDAMAMLLGQVFGEGRQGIGLGTGRRTGAQVVVELWADPQDGSWSITVTELGGPTCLITDGQGWEALADAPVAGDPA